MAGRRRRGRHLDALRDVLDAASLDAHDLPLPWAALGHLRSLLRSDLALFEGRDHHRGRSSFSQVATREVELYTAANDAGAPEQVRRLVRHATSERSRPGTGSDEVDVYSAAASARRRGALRGYVSHLLGHRTSTGSQLSAGIPDGYARELWLVCVRYNGRDFDERDRLDLRLLLPHLEAAYRRGEEVRATQCVTARQAMLMELVRDGYTNAQIATRLELAEGTVRSHLNNIYARLSVQSRTEAVNRLFGARPWTVDFDGSPLDVADDERAPPAGTRSGW